MLNIDNHLLPYIIKPLSPLRTFSLSCSVLRICILRICIRPEREGKRLSISPYFLYKMRLRPNRLTHVHQEQHQVSVRLMFVLITTQLSNSESLTVFATKQTIRSTVGDDKWFPQFLFLFLVFFLIVCLVGVQRTFIDQPVYVHSAESQTEVAVMHPSWLKHC